MSNTQRPTLQKQHTRSTEKNRNAELDAGLTIMVDGKEYTVRQGDLTSLDTMALRRETGFSFRSLLASFAADPDVDLVAALVWLSRRINGERMLAYADVASEIGYDVEIDVKDSEPEDDSPEA